MKVSVKVVLGPEPIKDVLLQKILRRCGAYYHSGALFYQEMWKLHLVQIGFRVLSVEKLSFHDVWDLRLCGNLTVQTHLLLSKSTGKQSPWTTDPLLKKLRSEIRRIAEDLGPPIKPDCITVSRTGAYFRVSFIWPMGRRGRLLKKAKKADALSLLIRPWLRRNRN